MNTIVEYFTGLNKMTDQVVAMDMLMSAKSGIKMYAIAATESATPEVKQVLRRHLDESIESHERMSAYMISRGLYHPYNMNEQIQLDMQNAQTALNIPAT
ncbi:spore coat protein [Paenibacillus xerothermodurans]|uniref:Spore coat protein n=1 Tax=Paenibacillus xerothermodurans TaxID=1977292 RepID=A0A2W1NC35_PAEXE|nr:spore coat protein [Paenibacillus xerothermodurans]PZE21220.1 spore coat protein [Paenibacillus xerothermodurans]